MARMRFRKSWAWNEDIDAFFRSRIEGFCVHVCAGESTLGDLRIDAFIDSVDIKADMWHLPIKTGVVDTVICDPPWGIEYTKRPRLHYELRRVLKLGGLLLFKALWLPRAPGLELVELWVAEFHMPGPNVSVLSAMRRNSKDLWGER